jgi:hypothetical protein
LRSVELRNDWFSSEKKSNPVALYFIDEFHPDYHEKVGKVIDKVLWTDDRSVFLDY